ncbi:MAG: hypothetical protein EXR93_08340 [Gemmatimonadetes bacterium]|nr:hypothetical protein [Gemmatimonadota bacterium]
MKSRSLVAAIALAGAAAGPALAQRGGEHPAPGMAGSRNMKVLAHIPLGGPFYANDIKVEQELSRPYAYVSGRSHFGYYIIDLKDPGKARLLYSWRIENPELHRGRALSAMHLKTNGRYYLTQSFQFQAGGPDNDLGAVIFDVTRLPDTTTIREVARIRVPDAPGGFHETYAYKHSDGRALLFTTSSQAFARVYDIAKTVTGDKEFGLIGKVPNPTSQAAGTDRGYHDFYVGYDPATKQDRFFGAGGGGFYVYDVTNIAEPKLVASATGISGMQNGHTFTPTPDGRYAVLESEYQYAPLRIIDLKPAYDGTVTTVSRPIGAWTQRWQGLPHNHEVRWPYVFVTTYEDGVQVFNMMDPTNPYTVASYDTYDGPVMMNKSKPFDPPTPGEGDVTIGSFGIDVRNADGLIVSADLNTGFWVFKMEGFDGWNGRQWGMPNQSSAQDWDNGPDGAPKPQKVS